MSIRSVRDDNRCRVHRLARRADCCSDVAQQRYSIHLHRILRNNNGCWSLLPLDGRRRGRSGRLCDRGGVCGRAVIDGRRRRSRGGQVEFRMSVQTVRSDGLGDFHGRRGCLNALREFRDGRRRYERLCHAELRDEAREQRKT